MPIKIQVIGADALVKVGALAKAAKEKLLQDLVRDSSDFGMNAVAIARKEYLNGPRPGKLAHKTGELSRRMTSQVRQDGNVITTTVGNNMEYAATHEFGDKRTVDVTQRMRKFAWAMFYKTRDEKWKRFALTKKTQFVIKIPKRPFMRPAVMDAMPTFQQNIARTLQRISLVS